MEKEEQKSSSKTLLYVLLMHPSQKAPSDAYAGLQNLSLLNHKYQNEETASGNNESCQYDPTQGGGHQQVKNEQAVIERERVQAKIAERVCDSRLAGASLAFGV